MRYTSKVQEIRVLMELVEDSARAIFDIRCSENSDRVGREGFRKLRTTIVVFLSRNSWGHYDTQSAHYIQALLPSVPSPGRNRCGCVSCSGCPNRSFEACTLCHLLHSFDPTTRCRVLIKRCHGRTPELMAPERMNRMCNACPTVLHGKFLPYR
jgi:hypothetical protein